MNLSIPFKPLTNVIGPPPRIPRGWEWFWENPIGLYPLLDSGKAVAQQPRKMWDYSGRKNHLDLTAGFPSNIWYPEYFGQGLEFSTAEQLRATAGQVLRDQLTSLKSATFILLIKKVDATPVASTLLSQLGGASDTHYPYSDGLGYFSIFRSSRVNSVTLSSSVTRNQWHMLIITTSPSAYRVYQNDVKVVDVAGESSVTIAGSGALSVLGQSPVYNFDGRIGAFYLLGNAITEDQVRLLVNDPWGGFRKTRSKISIPVSSSTNLTFSASLVQGTLSTLTPTVIPVVNKTVSVDMVESATTVFTPVLNGIVNNTVSVDLTTSTTRVFQNQAKNKVDLSTIGVRKWIELGDTRMDTVAQTPTPPGAFAGFFAWSGGVYDTKRNKLVLWGGGHTNYAGNEIYAYDLINQTWDRIRNASTITSGVESTGYYDTSAGVPDEQQPRARHTYGSITYVPDPYDYMASLGAVTVYVGASSLANTDRYSFTTSSWSRGTDAIGYGTGQINAWDPVTKRIFFHGMTPGGRFLADYNPATDTYTAHDNGESLGSLDNSMYGFLDPVRRRLWAFGNGKAYYWNVSTSATVSEVNIVTTSGDQGLVNAISPGVVYDPVGDKAVGWVSGTDVYTYNLDTYYWTKVSAATDNPYTPSTPQETGTFGRFQFVPDYNIFVLYNRSDSNVFVYKLEDSLNFNLGSSNTFQPTVVNGTNATVTPSLTTVSGFDFGPSVNGAANVSTSLTTVSGVEFNFSVNGSANVSVGLNTVSGVEFSSAVNGSANVSIGLTTVSGIEFSHLVNGSANVQIGLTTVSGIAFDDSVITGATIFPGLNTVSGVEFGQNISTGLTLFPELTTVSASLLDNSLSLSNLVNLNLTTVSGLVDVPAVQAGGNTIVQVGLNSVSGFEFEPNLSISSSISIGLTTVSGFTFGESLSLGNLVSPELLTLSASTFLAAVSNNSNATITPSLTTVSASILNSDLVITSVVTPGLTTVSGFDLSSNVVGEANVSPNLLTVSGFDFDESVRIDYVYPGYLTTLSASVLNVSVLTDAVVAVEMIQLATTFFATGFQNSITATPGLLTVSGNFYDSIISISKTVQVGLEQIDSDDFAPGVVGNCVITPNLININGNAFAVQNNSSVALRVRRIEGY